jgi:hypothetical protein
MASNLGMSSWSFEAPAEHQSPPSMLTALSTVWMHGLEFSNTQSFRCFQTSHATKIIKELRPLRTSFGTALITFLHHPEKRLTEGSGTNCIKPKSWKIDAQTWREKTQPTSKWLIVSLAWSQNGQTSGWGRPCLARRSAVQHRLCSTSQMKNLQHRGAQLFQILLHGLNLMVPTKKINKQTCCCRGVRVKFKILTKF